MWKYAVAVVVMFSVWASGCGVISTSPQLHQGVLGPRCTEWKLVANAWSINLLPYVIREKAEELIAVAKSRRTHGGTDPTGYKGDAVSRTLGFILRNDVKDRARVNMVLRVYYLDPVTTYVVRYLGVLHVTNGVGEMILSDDPRKWIVEMVWSHDFISPVKSGGEPRLWLFGDEWKFHCTMNVHGLVP